MDSQDSIDDEFQNLVHALEKGDFDPNLGNHGHSEASDLNDPL